MTNGTGGVSTSSLGHLRSFGSSGSSLGGSGSSFGSSGSSWEATFGSRYSAAVRRLALKSSSSFGGSSGSAFGNSGSSTSPTGGTDSSSGSGFGSRLLVVALVPAQAVGSVRLLELAERPRLAERPPQLAERNDREQQRLRHTRRNVRRGTDRGSWLAQQENVDQGLQEADPLQRMGICLRSHPEHREATAGARHHSNRRHDRQRARTAATGTGFGSSTGSGFGSSTGSGFGSSSGSGFGSSSGSGFGSSSGSGSGFGSSSSGNGFGGSGSSNGPGI